jgi:hypothetical protein
LAIVRTPGAGRVRTQRSGAMTAAAAGLGEIEARGLRREEVGDVGAISAPVAVMPTNTGRSTGGSTRCLPRQRGVRLVADDDRVRVGDLAALRTNHW